MLSGRLKYIIKKQYRPGGGVAEEAEEGPHRRGWPDTRAGHEGDEESDAHLQGEGGR